MKKEKTKSYIDFVDGVALMCYAILHNKPDAVRIENNVFIINEKELDSIFEEEIEYDQCGQNSCYDR